MYSVMCPLIVVGVVVCCVLFVSRGLLCDVMCWLFVGCLLCVALLLFVVVFVCCDCVCSC